MDVEKPALPADAASSSGDGEGRVFEQASQKVLKRVLLRRALLALTKAFWPMLGGLAGLGLWGWFGGGAVAGGVALAALLGLLGVVGFVVWRQLPSAYAALALWDRQTGRREAFAAAGWFEGLSSRTAAEEAHYRAQRERLAEALERLPEDLPLPPWKLLLALPAMALLACWAGWQAEARSRGPELSSTMVATAAAQARVVAALEKQVEAMKGLTEEEQARLRQQLQEAAEMLENSAGSTARELLDALEDKARETEKLAQRLAAKGDAWASPELTEALRRQADTADLGDAVADQQALAAAGAAEALAETLEGAEGDLEERLQEVLKNVQESSQPEDGERPVGAAVAEGAQALEAGQTAQAAQAMRELAQQMRELSGQRQTQQAMEQLAQQLREAGSQVAGAESGAGQAAVSQAAEAGKEGANAQAAAAQNGGAMPDENTPTGEGAMATAAQNPAGESGAGQSTPGESANAMVGERDPGAGRGGGQPDSGAPLLVAPVPPGGAGSEKPPEMTLVMPGGPPGGGALAGSGNALPPGSGSPQLAGKEATEAMASQQQALVNAASSREGSAMRRQVEGGAPGEEEEAQRGGAAMTVEFLEAQESALEESSLPAARREQVRRYFNALRQRLESGGR